MSVADKLAKISNSAKHVALRLMAEKDCQAGRARRGCRRWKASGKESKKPKRQSRPEDAAAVPAAYKPPDRLARLAGAVRAVRAGEQPSPRTAKLMAGGVPKMAQKLVEEASETAIDAVRAERTGFINESADLLYNLVVLWCALDVEADEVWAEMDRREALLGMAEKLPKTDDGAG